jgi:hypothetical protein
MMRKTPAKRQRSRLRRNESPAVIYVTDKVSWWEVETSKGLRYVDPGEVSSSPTFSEFENLLGERVRGASLVKGYGVQAGATPEASSWQVCATRREQDEHAEDLEVAILEAMREKY